MEHINILQLLWLGLIATSLDVDNALYMTSQIKALDAKEQKKAIFYGIVLEYVGRIALIVISLYLLSGNQPLFTLSGIHFTAQNIALLFAGAFLFLKSSKELIDFLEGKEEKEESVSKAGKSFSRLLIEMSIVNIVLSIDTVIAVTGMSKVIIGMAIILSVSSIIRFFFVKQIGKFMEDHPAMNVVITSFLILIGLQLLLQAFNDDLPEMYFNIGLILAVIVQILYVKYGPFGGAKSVKKTVRAAKEIDQAQNEVDEL